ncbi:MAG: hypothetical protein J6R18_04840 [Kiritimatiellae bacterium]|nr:hypothetical protein [Kiritimatiellia bacterium]
MNSGSAEQAFKVSAMAVAAFCVAFAGCDFNLPSLRTATEKVAQYSEEVQPPKESPVRPAANAGNARAELLHSVSAKIKIIDADLAQASKEINEVRSDKEAMSKAISELTEKVFSDKDAKKEDVVLAMLKDDRLNALAAKYLGADFSLPLAGYISEMRAAYALQNSKDGELTQSSRRFDAEIACIGEKNRLDRDRANQEISALQKKIDETERRIRFLRGNTMLSKKNSRERDSKVAEAVRDINDWQARIAKLRAQRSSANVGKDAKQAYDRLENAKKEIEKRYSKMESAVDVADKYETANVKRLLSELSKAEDAKRRLIDLLARQKLHIESLSSGLDDLNAASLERVRGKIEKVLSWTSEGNVAGDKNVRSR